MGLSCLSQESHELLESAFYLHIPSSKETWNIYNAVKTDGRLQQMLDEPRISISNLTRIRVWAIHNKKCGNMLRWAAPEPSVVNFIPGWLTYKVLFPSFPFSSFLFFSSNIIKTCKGQKTDYHCSIPFISVSEMVSALFPKKYDSSFSPQGHSHDSHSTASFYSSKSLPFIFLLSTNQYMVRALWYELHLLHC